MFLKESVLINNTNDITSNNKGSFLKASDWFEVPFFVLIEAWKLNTSWDEDALVSSNSDFFKWSLDTIENCFQNTWSKFDRKRLTSSQDWITISESRCVLIALDGGSISLKLNDLTDKLVPTDLNELVHF